MKMPRCFRKSEYGRSMVEILGVLAVIGLLSLGSVWLYDYASKFYEANHIQDSLAKAKSMADINQSPTHIREVERLLRQTVGEYNPEIQQTEIRNSSDGQKMTYTVTLKHIDERVCQLMMNKKDVLSSVDITIMSPASADECAGGIDMGFAFDTIRTDIICQNDGDCAGTNNPFCKDGQCKACEPSDCHGTEPICNKYSGACEPCSNDDECHPNKCAANGSCGECSSNTHCTDEFRPICDTYEGNCKACATDGECEPKYCAGNGTCGDCSAHPHCPNTKPKCDAELGVCEACPSATPVWKADEEKCITCYASNNATPYWNGTKCISCYTANTAKPYWNGSACTTCPTATPVWNTTQNKCVTCYATNSAKPYWNGSACTTCPTATPIWNTTQNKCVTCYATNSAKPYWNGSACTTCPTATPVWNTTQNKCVTCYATNSAKPYWNGSACTTCPTATPVWSTTENKCISCATSNSATPYWNGTKCVSCYTANTAKPYWNGSTCTTCPTATPVWDTTQNKCVSCYATNSAKPYWNGSACTTCPTATPIWNTTENKCISCATSNSATPYWNGTKCVSCYTANTAKPYWNGSTCTTCPSSASIWSTSLNKCVQCTQNSQCSGTTPICNTSTNKCEKCSSSSQCLSMDKTKPFCKSTGACACPDSSTYSSEWGTCAFDVASGESAWGSKSKSGQLYDKTPDVLSTYEASYHVYWSGYADDYIVLATGVVWEVNNVTWYPTNHTIITKGSCWGCENVYLGVIPAGVKGTLYIDSYQGYLRCTQGPHATLVYKPE